MKKKLISVATIQFEPKQFDKEYNIKVLSEMVEKAAKNNAKLIVTPEMGTTGYCWYNRDEVKEYVEKIPGITTNHFLKISKKFNCYIVIGMPEVDEINNLYYNSAVLIGPDGIVGKHRKSHPYIAEPKWACNGNNDHEVYETEIGKISLLICMDLHFFETSRIQAIKDVDIICHISNWLAERAPAPYWINRAFENNCYVIESNRWGLERTVQFSGGSCIINPDGQIQNFIDTGNGIVYGEVDVTHSYKKVLEEKVFEKRRPELYAELMNNSFTWNPNDFFTLYGKNPIPKGKKSKVSVVQSFPKNDIVKNIDFIEKTVRKLKKKDKSNLVLFPELFITGIDNPFERALDLKSSHVDRLCKIAIKNKVYIISGFAEIKRDKLFNSVVILGEEGILGTYQKTHLSNDDEDWASHGSNLKTFDTKIGRIGVSIGTENFYPEISRILSIKGCDLILSPSAIYGKFTSKHQGTKIPHNYPIPTGYDPYHWHLIRVRAGENNVYNAFSNVISKSKNFLGKSGVFGPETFIFPRFESPIIDENETISLEIDTSSKNHFFSENSVRRKDMLKMRLTHHYYPLINKGNY